MYQEYVHTFTDDGCNKIILSHVEDNEFNKIILSHVVGDM